MNSEIPTLEECLAGARVVCKGLNFSDAELDHRGRMIYLINKFSFPDELKVLLDVIEYECEIRNLNKAYVMPSLQDFKAIRLQRGLTLREVEELTGISNAYLSQLESGKIKKPSFDVVSKLHNLFCNGA